jgi:cation diffusion facilitator family transporter
MSSAKSRAAAVSVASNASLVAVKLAVGFLTGSVSIVSEAIHSANDLLAALIAFASVKTSDKAADDEHPYGHGKIEGVSGAVEAALIVLAAGWIIFEAVQRIRHGGEVEHLGAGTAVMAFSAVVNILVSRHLFRVARAEGSLALEADAHHLSTDVYTSAGVAVGLAVVWATGATIVDPIVAILVALFILKIGVTLTIDAVQHLLDRGLPPEEVRRIEAILRAEPMVLDVHRLRTRKSGSLREVDVHVAMSGTVPLADAHAVVGRLEGAIEREFAPAHAVIHVDPFEVLPPGRVPQARNPHEGSTIGG